MRRLFGLAGLLLVPVVTLHAQHSPRPFERWTVETLDRPATRQASGLEVAPVQVPGGDYRYEGLALGGIVFGLAGAWMGSEAPDACPMEPGVDCGRDRLGNAVVLGLAGAALGGGLGYLIGRLSPKPESASANRRQAAALPDSVRRRVGYQHWEGGAIGGALGTVAGLLLSAVPIGCSDCSSKDSKVVKATFIGAGLGAAFGFVVGAASPKYKWQAGAAGTSEAQPE
jgi:hypothetical protein